MSASAVRALFSPASPPYRRASLRRYRPARHSRPLALPEGFQPPADVDAAPSAPALADGAPRDDDALPDSLDDAVLQSCNCTALALSSGATDRAIVELIIPELWDPISGAVMAESGDQMRLWDLSRTFVDTFSEAMDNAGSTSTVHVLYPDEGVAAMLRNRWKDENAAAFTIGSMNQRRPLANIERPDVVIVASPDPQSLDPLQSLELAAAELGCAIVLLNPRLASGDAGIGLNVRRMRQNFLNRFAVTYSLRPIEDFGAQLKKYPDAWKVFLADPELPGRYQLAREVRERPSADVMEQIIDAYARKVQGESGEEPKEEGPLDGLVATMRSVQRFMRDITK